MAPPRLELLLVTDEKSAIPLEILINDSSYKMLGRLSCTHVWKPGQNWSRLTFVHCTSQSFPEP